jgi:chemotaxis protein methyltransferase CheR
MNEMATTPVAREPAILESDYQEFCAYFYSRTGISFGDKKRYYVDKRLIERIQKTGAETFAQYFIKLTRTNADGEIEKLTNLLTVNETYFYRESYQFACMVESMLPELTATRRRGGTIRIWSIPCSTGEEPYSIALYLLENWPSVDNYDIEIIGSDIDTRALQAAQTAVYDTRALQELSQAVISRYFTTLPGQKFQLSDSIRDSVRFSQLNVSDAAAMRNFKQIDILFCRNMLIYFDDASRLATVQRFYDCMTPGGFICLGHSESMSRISSIFSLRQFAQAMVYQKPLGQRR